VVKLVGDLHRIPLQHPLIQFPSSPGQPAIQHRVAADCHAGLHATASRQPVAPTAERNVRCSDQAPNTRLQSVSLACSARLGQRSFPHEAQNTYGAPMANELTWKQAIEQVLAASATPLHYTEITERIIADKLRKNLGATPAATVNSLISATIKKEGTSAPYVRVAKGTFTLTKAAAPPNVVVSPEEDDEAELQYDIITSFGMYWRRAAVEWTASPKLLGMQRLGATPVDFSKQLGIYLLYDGREVIYVGRSTDRPLGRRLYEHTNDRLAVRWDRFSWFGLKPISEVGELGDLPSTYDSNKLIPALEAILIEAMEPRQNRKRGDDLSSVEYMQKEDPAITKNRMKQVLALALDKI